MTDRYYLVTGGSGGLGAAICDELAAHGYRPVIGYATGDGRAREVAGRSGRVPLHLDLADAGVLDGALASLREMGTTLEGIVLAHSPPPVLSRFGKIDPAELRHQLEVNVVGVQRLLAGVVAGHFRKAKRGLVIGVLSEAMGDDAGAMSGMGAYVVGKYGMAGVLALLAADYSWLTVRSLRPGFIDTPMLRVFDDRFLAPMRARGEIRQPQEVARSIRDIVADYGGTQEVISGAHDE
jgi:NAD(P)-dependent dehydrogenase (short-subunit alcohol dehydrogenase family)